MWKEENGQEKRTPKKIKEGQTVGIAGAYPGGVATTVELFYRTRGQNVYAKLKSPVAPTGDFTVSVPGVSPELDFWASRSRSFWFSRASCSTKASGFT